LPTLEPDTIEHLVRIFPHATVKVIAKCGPAAAGLFAKLESFRGLFEQPLTRDELRRKNHANYVEVEDEVEFEKTHRGKITRLAKKFGSLWQNTTATHSAKMVYPNRRAWQVLEHFEELSGVRFWIEF
jgi:hypothetical protein